MVLPLIRKSSCFWGLHIVQAPISSQALQRIAINCTRRTVDIPLLVSYQLYVMPEDRRRQGGMNAKPNPRYAQTPKTTIL